ncbi:expressed unknown protein [Seminavis robusta]|uniref:SCP domain-containing protein n=1 Tax=Seminavis robusta TaxID=568900 RepID=A0A9N8E2D3_9STRA|nr:expressed unknown protein [Seminavis robusta]|eukprot:Sro436_g142610.1 n/a (235) ;mRNA; r:27235-27939
MTFKLFTNRRSVLAEETIVQKTQKGKTRRRLLALFNGDKKKHSTEATKLLGGKYLSKKAMSLRSIDTSENSDSETATSWKSCSSQEYRRPKLSYEDRQKEWGKAVAQSKRLPSTAHFSNNIIMVNKERTKRTIPAISRSSHLDAVARWHAEVMALEGAVRHSNPAELQTKLADDTCTFLGENVAAGTSIRTMHQQMVDNVGDLRNMTDNRYKEMGCGTARGADGELYLCQIFRG